MDVQVTVGVQKVLSSGTIVAQPNQNISIKSDDSTIEISFDQNRVSFEFVSEKLIRLNVSPTQQFYSSMSLIGNIDGKPITFYLTVHKLGGHTNIVNYMFGV